jgi:hypothetical protein
MRPCGFRKALAGPLLKEKPCGGTELKEEVTPVRPLKHKLFLKPNKTLRYEILFIGVEIAVIERLASLQYLVKVIRYTTYH